MCLRGVLRAVSCREILGVGNQLHVAMHALFEFQDAHGGQLPALHSAADADELVAFAHRQQATAAALPAMVIMLWLLRRLPPKPEGAPA